MTEARCTSSTLLPVMNETLFNLALNRSAVELGGAFVSAPASLAARMPPKLQAAFRHFGHAVRNGRRAIVAAFGGSMLAGAKCSDGVPEHHWQPSCAFASRFASALSKDIDFINLAVGGTPTAGILPSLHALLQGVSTRAAQNEPVLLLLDYSGNDGQLGLNARSVLDLRAAVESLLRYILSSWPSFAFLLVETYHSAPVDKWLRMAYADVAVHYGVPHLRYANVARNWRYAWYPNPACDKNGLAGKRDDARRYGTGDCVHPPWQTHQLIAEVLIISYSSLATALCEARALDQAQLAAAAAAVLPAALSQRAQLERFAVCEQPLASYSAASLLHAASTTPGVRITSGNWSLYEDRPGKPGWITLGPANSTIEFDLRFGRAPRLVLSYMKGYSDDLGVVELRMHVPTRWRSRDPTRRYAQLFHWAKLDGRVPEDAPRVTQTYMLSMAVADTQMQNYAMNTEFQRSNESGFSGVLGYGIEPHSEATARFTLSPSSCMDGSGSSPSTGTGCKFKIVSLTSC